MKQFSQTQRDLIQLLADTQCHSGSELGNALRMSRTAIWKQINQLVDIGVPINRISNQGYQLSRPFELIDSETIKKKVSLKTPFSLNVFTSLDSTNKFLKDLPASAELDFCLTEVQTQGRGRFGRQWHSPFGENIYCSGRWNLNGDLNKLSGLSLVISLAVLNTLKAHCPTDDIYIKWPNDILWQDKKLCGILIEILAESNSSAQVIIGIGLNVNSDTETNPLPDKAWCSLYEITKKYHSRNEIIANLINTLDRYLHQFLAAGLGVFMDEWQKLDYLFGKNITVTQALNTISGIAKGINEEGLLILEEENGNRLYLSSGDTTLNSRT